ncbi:helix-turn-helix transcriptional regulator [Micromonospora sp. NPDC047548]|uniref:helix-turn-helix domain-containing protein n=1 Tax=Micromonospora sp. NPDC047548 TaxID=3155624 RepID=UPI0033E90227
MDLGRTVRAMRRRADLSQRELAERSGVPQATIARIESGRATDPRFRTIEAIVGAVAGRIMISVPPAGGAVAPATGGIPTADGGHVRAEDAGGSGVEVGGRGVAEEGGHAATTCGLPSVPHDELRDAGVLGAPGLYRRAARDVLAVRRRAARRGVGRRVAGP